MENFQEIKNKIICSAKESNACKTEFNRALNSKDIQELLKVVKDNFNYCCNNKIITKDLLEEIGKEVCEENDLFLNVSTNKGYLFADSATVRAWGSATVRASDSATVEAWDSATVEAWGSATVEAWGSATVRASDSATVEAWDSATVEAWGSATVRAWGSATVEAWGSAYINSFNSLDHKISDKVILRYYFGNKVILAENISNYEKR